MRKSDNTTPERRFLSSAGVFATVRKELLSYFSTPVAYIFLSVFLMAGNAFAFYLSDLYGREQADLQSFFVWAPWLLLFFVPAVSMRLWAEERRSGTFELLSALPVPMWRLVTGKFLAAWIFVGAALALSTPLWAVVCYLGNPDNGVVLCGYLGSLLLAGAYLAVGSCISALTQAQASAFVATIFVCFLFTVAGYPMVMNFFREWLPQAALEAVSSMSFLMHFDSFTRGVVELPALLFFGLFIGIWLFITSCVLEEF